MYAKEPYSLPTKKYVWRISHRASGGDFRSEKLYTRSAEGFLKVVLDIIMFTHYENNGKL
jgi:hypothetical protein